MSLRVVGSKDVQTHLQNVWHYALEFGCYSYSPMHFASAFQVL